MSEAERTGLDHVVLPRRRPGLALLERHRPSPADNVLDAELAAFAAPGDTVLDPWAGTGSVARRAVGHGMRAVAADASPFSQLAAIAFLNAPDPSVLDAAFAQLAGSRRVDVPLQPAHRGALRLALRRLPAARRGRPVHLAARRRRTRPQDLSLRVVRRVGRRARGARRAGRRGRPRQARHRARRAAARADCRRGRGAAAGAGRPDRDRRGAAGEDEAPIGETGGPPEPPSPAADPPSGLGDRPRFASTVRPDPLPVPRPRASATARSTSSSVPDSPSSTVATSSSPSCSTSTRRATSTRSTRSAPRSTASCATPAPPPPCAWRSPPACCRRAA